MYCLLFTVWEFPLNIRVFSLKFEQSGDPEIKLTEVKSRAFNIRLWIVRNVRISKYNFSCVVVIEAL
ncbi:uncharacterized protein cubi_03138 [Cryptosporidium ubiquitum]|uniref:Uncharacterized protein n=1 Tax=Cryptosporidium ubiquitum TaxID=857276 RepID=A0A1J4MPW2_9CRYT|nr:uncharacterized protein cubi_03138 [Cryptosporidium ubiquitum]OII75028.1 hypothetical protein cubi_03138 [Cryptosporidium ubiquitum]